MNVDEIKRKFPGYASWNDVASILADFKATGGAGKGPSTPSSGSSTFSTPAISNQVSQDKLLADTAAQRSEFMNRVNNIPSALTALSDQLGVTAAQNTFKTAGETARNVAGQVANIAPTQQTIAKQVGISAPRLQQRIASETGKLQPALSSATEGLSAAQSGLESVLGTYNTQAQGIFKPLDIEAGLLGDSIKSQFDLFKTNTQQALDLEIKKLTETGLNDRATLDRATKLAEAEKAATSGQFVDLGNRYALIDPTTGKELQSFSKGLTPTQTQTSAIGEWE